MLISLLSTTIKAEVGIYFLFDALSSQSDMCSSPYLLVII